MKNFMKGLVRNWWKYFLISYTVYGVSESLKRTVQTKFNKLKAEKEGEEYEVITRPVLYEAYDNFKEVGNMFVKYVNEKES